MQTRNLLAMSTAAAAAAYETIRAVAVDIVVDVVAADKPRMWQWSNYHPLSAKYSCCSYHRSLLWIVPSRILLYVLWYFSLLNDV